MPKSPFVKRIHDLRIFYYHFEYGDYPTLEEGNSVGVPVLLLALGTCLSFIAETNEFSFTMCLLHNFGHAIHPLSVVAQGETRHCSAGKVEGVSRVARVFLAKTGVQLSWKGVVVVEPVVEGGIRLCRQRPVIPPVITPGEKFLCRKNARGKLKDLQVPPSGSRKAVISRYTGNTPGADVVLLSVKQAYSKRIEL